MTSLTRQPSVDFYFGLALIHHPHNTTRGDCRRPRRHQGSTTPKMTTRRSRRVYRAGIQGTLTIYFHFIYISNPLPPSPQPQPVPLHGKRPDALPLASHSSPYPSPTHQHVPHNPNTRMCPCGHILVFPLPSLVSFYHPDMKTRYWGRVFMSGVSLQPSHHPLPPRHEERDHRVVFFVSGMFPTPSLHPLPPRHEERDPTVMFFVSRVSLRLPLYHHPLPPRHKERDHRVAFFVSGMLPTPQT